MRLYLDNNVYNRPFDDLSVPRNKAEAWAVEDLFGMVSAGDIELVSSFVVETEHSLSPPGLRREEVGVLIGMAGEIVRWEARISRRATEFEAAGLRGRDALHLAAAERAGADYFVTCDDKLLRRARRIRARVKVLPPLELLEKGV